MNSQEVLTLLRQSAPRLPDDAEELAKTSASARACLVLRGSRPYTAPLLTALGLQAAEWRTAVPKCAGLHLVKQGQVVPLPDQMIYALFRSDPFLFCAAMAETMLATSVSALKVNLSELQPQLDEFDQYMSESGLRQKFELFLGTQTIPGLLVVAGIVYVALKKQRAPDLESTKTIVKNTIPIILEWASQSITGHTVLKNRFAWTNRHYLKSYPGKTLLRPEYFTLVDPDTPVARLEFSSESIHKLATDGVRELTQKVNYRIGCVALTIQIGGRDMVSDSVYWALEILETFWDLLQFPKPLQGRRFVPEVEKARVKPKTKQRLTKPKRKELSKKEKKKRKRNR